MGEFLVFLRVVARSGPRRSPQLWLQETDLRPGFRRSAKSLEVCNGDRSPCYLLCANQVNDGTIIYLLWPIGWFKVRTRRKSSVELVTKDTRRG